MKIRFEDRLKGGIDVANLGKYLNRFDPKEVKMGIKDEKEHTNDPKIAAEIASDHLATEPHYYTKLKKANVESIDVFEFNFFDILESGWNPDEPMFMQVDKTKSSFSKTPLTGKQRRAEKRAAKWASIEGQLEKDGASVKSIRDAQAVFDNTDRGGRPLGVIPTNKHLGIYSTPGKPKGTKNKPVTTVGKLSKERFVTMDNVPDTRPRQDRDKSED